MGAQAEEHPLRRILMAVDAAANRDVSPDPARDTGGIAGQPRGLMTLFFTEMWERFSYYGMRAFLVLFMVAPVESGGLGFPDGRAGIIYGMYTAMVYMLSVPGGWIADRFVGQQNAVLYGGVLIMAGHICLAMPVGATFYIGLALVALGTGLLKPNVSSIVGQLYSEEDKRRDSGFTIFYMGINLGAFAAPLICGAFFAESETFRAWLSSVGIDPRSAWHFAFGSAAVGMFFGLVQFMLGRGRLGNAGRFPTPPKDAAEASRNKGILVAVLVTFLGIPALIGGLGASGSITLSPEIVGGFFQYLLPLTAIVVLAGLLLYGASNADERRRLVVVAILFVAAAVFWGCFEQAGSTLTLFAERNTDRTLPESFLGIPLGGEFGATVYQSLNSIFVIALAPVFAYLWIVLARMRKEPPTIAKFGLGMLGVGLGFLILVPAAYIVLGGSKVGPHWLVILYLIHTCGELCLSPVGLSAMSKLAPARLAGLIMGVWFLAASVGNFMAGFAVKLTETMQMDSFFLLMTVVPIILGAILFLLSKPVQRMLDRTEAERADTGFPPNLDVAGASRDGLD
jgi:proton-dependent oligopeptide transporter, POT family